MYTHGLIGRISEDCYLAAFPRRPCISAVGTIYRILSEYYLIHTAYGQEMSNTRVITAFSLSHPKRKEQE
jgi:hypothetical protein